MPKLTSAQRKNLPEDQFGIPEDKAFPMPDEAHVRSAIAYFHTCPPKKKKQLANNINRIAKQYNMKIKLKKYSAFKPYADKDIIAEESVNIDYLEAPIVTIDEIHKIDEIAREEYFDKFHEAINKQNIDETYRSCRFSDRLNDAINQAIKKAAQNYLDKEYILNGRLGTTKISDYIYDSDLKLCYDITRNFFYTKSVYDADMIAKIKRVTNKDMLINAFNEIKKHTDAPIISKMCDDVNYMINQNRDDPFGEYDWWSDCDWRLKDEILNPRDWAFNHIKLEDHDDFGFLARPSNFLNFSEEEIWWFQQNYTTIHELCSLALFNMIHNFGFPQCRVNMNVSNDVIEMSRRGIIDGYYISGDNDTIKKNFDFRVVVKMNNVIWIPVHLYRDEEKSIVTMLKIFDNDVHKNYYTHICDIYLRSRKKTLPKMPVRRITFYTSKTTLEQAMSGITVSRSGEIELVNT